MRLSAWRSSRPSKLDDSQAFDRVIITVDDPAAVVRTINEAARAV